MLFCDKFTYLKCCFFILIFFLGCAKHSEDILTTSLQKDLYFYGEGIATDFALAKQHAMQDLVTNLQVSIKYVTQNTMQQYGKDLQTSSISNIFIQSSIKDLPGLEVNSTKRHGKQIVVSVRVKKAILQELFSSQIQSKIYILHSMLEKCNTVPFDQYLVFKSTYEELLNDLSLYLAISNTNPFPDLIDLQKKLFLPAYKIVWKFQNTKHRLELEQLLQFELAKFITIDSQSTRTLEIVVDTNDVFQVFLNFYDCKQELESVVYVNTHIRLHDIFLQNSKQRLGAIFYKALQDSRAVK